MATARKSKRSPRRKDPLYKRICATKKKKLQDYGDMTYPGFKIGHRECVMPYFFVPPRMGWLWNIHTPCMNLKVNIVLTAFLGRCEGRKRRKEIILLLLLYKISSRLIFSCISVHSFLFLKILIWYNNMASPVFHDGRNHFSDLNVFNAAPN